MEFTEANLNRMIRLIKSMREEKVTANEIFLALKDQGFGISINSLIKLKISGLFEEAKRGKLNLKDLEDFDNKKRENEQ